MMEKKAYLTKRNHVRKVKAWFSVLQPFRGRWKAWSFQESVLLVIDVQEYFFNPASHAYVPSADFLKSQIQKLVDRFRAQKRPIIFTTFAVKSDERDIIRAWWGESVKIGSKDASLSLNPQKDRVLRKPAYSAFIGTSLETLLKKMRIKRVLISGVLTNLCCESTACDAFNRGYDVFFAVDGTAAYNEKMHLNSLKNIAYGFASPLVIDELLMDAL